MPKTKNYDETTSRSTVVPVEEPIVAAAPGTAPEAIAEGALAPEAPIVDAVAETIDLRVAAIPELAAKNVGEDVEVHIVGKVSGKEGDRLMIDIVSAESMPTGATEAPAEAVAEAPVLPIPPGPGAGNLDVTVAELNKPPKK